MNMIVAVDRNWGIGNKGKLLVQIKDDLKFFKKMTLNKTIVYGRETLKTFPNGQPLVDRVNIILSRNKDYKIEKAIVVHSEEELFSLLYHWSSEDIFFIGGQTIYEQFLSCSENVYVTKINSIFDADKHFPNIDAIRGWKVVKVGKDAIENNIEYQFYQYKNDNKSHPNNPGRKHIP